MKKNITVLGDRILTRPLKINTKIEKKNSNIVMPENNQNQDKPQRYNYDDHKFQAEVLKVGWKYKLKTFFLPPSLKICKGDVVYHIGGDGFMVVQDDIDYLVLENSRIIGINQQGKGDKEYLLYKDV